jgi:hypothetical protein
MAARLLSQATSFTQARLDMFCLSLHELQTKWFIRSQEAEVVVSVRGILLEENVNKK